MEPTEPTASEAPTTPEAPPMEPNVNEAMKALLKRIEDQEKRLAEAAADKAKAEAKAAEAAERIRLMAQHQASRPSSVLTSAVLEDAVAPQAQVKESQRVRVRPDQVRKAQGADLGEQNRVLVCHNLRGSGRSEVQVTLPDHVRLAHSKDAYVAVFEDHIARVPQIVAEILCSSQPRRYQLAN